MSKIVPNRNISPVLVDIKRPGADYNLWGGNQSINLAHVPEQPLQSNAPRIWLSAIMLIILMIGGVGISIFSNFKSAKSVFDQKGHLILENFSGAIDSLRKLKPVEASSKLNSNQKELNSLADLINQNSGKVLFSTIGSVVPAVKEASGLLGRVASFNLNFLKLAEGLGDLQINGFDYFQNNGSALIDKLKNTRGLLQKIITDVESIRNTTADLKETSSAFEIFDQLIGDQYLKYSSDLQLWGQGLNGLITLLDIQNDEHFVVIFQNPAEIRPGGGFVGSYADLTINNGQLKNMEVQDIYWPDHPMNFKLKVVPPEPLQNITTDWGARDANWFFDFPTSAKTVLNFLEASKIYEEKGIKFGGLIGLNINVLKSILELIGPIEIPEYEKVIDKDNFLIEIQREVETGRDKKAGQNPKRILSVMTPIIFERLNRLSTEQKFELVKKFEEHFGKKDIMIFVKDSNLANLLAANHIDGSVFSLPHNFWGSYLAVVNANIAGGKSDVFIDQSISGRIDIDTDGSVFTDLTITRSHHGDKEKDSWWRADNKDFIQIFTNPGSNLISIKGNDKPQPKNSATDYKVEGYEINSDLAAIDETKIFLVNQFVWTMEEFGKKVFGTWFNTPAGQSKDLNLRYQVPASNQFSLNIGEVFQFIFQKQSGVNSKINLAIGAPLGYKWLENNSPVFNYENDDFDGLAVLNLTLAR